ncbi:MAG TPA: TonB-dependent receptor [Terriglobia bacterium]|nr:TonB-dependent receptor [Terriglobia bacterium]
MKRIGLCVLVGFLAFALAGATAWAQSTTAQINGTVKDPSGAVLPGVEVTVTQTATGAKRSTVSNETGNYVLASLPLGPYMLQAELPGFKAYVQTGIVLQVDANPTINVVLQIGQVSEQVEVQADAGLVETRTTAIGHVVTNQEVAEMPLNGRDAHELIFLAGMATYPGQGSMNSIRNYPTVVVSVAGGNGDGVSYLLDGSVWQDPYNSLSLPLPFPDALQEFKVETSAMPAQFGFHATATVNAVTKSGTNEFHGDMFEFVRNGMLNARDAFATKRDTLKRNQFGGVIGGPIKKDKLFFFGGYQRTSLRSDGIQNTAFIPTPAALNGDFTALASPECNNGRSITLPASLGFVNNTISPSALNPVAVKIAKTFPVSNNPCGRTLYGLVANQDEDLVTAKVDYTINAKHSIFGRYMLGKLNQGSTYDGTNPLSINSYGFQDFDYGFNVGDTYLIGNNIVNSLRIAANRTNIVKLVDNYKNWADFGANVSPLAGNVIAITSPAGSAFLIGGGAASPGAQHNGPMPSVVEDLSWLKGSHQFGFGGAIYQQRLNYYSGVNAVGTANFDGSTTGLVLGDFMMGRPLTFNQGTVYGFYTRQYYDSLYAQDNWNVTPRLTLNYGVRWEPYLSPYNNRGENEHFDFSLFAQNVHTKVFTNAPPGLVFPGDSQYTSGKYINGPRWAKFFPRVGLAWDPEGKGRTTIRAGYGMYGDRAMMLAGTQVYFSAPFGNLVSAQGANLTDPWAGAGGNPMVRLAALQGVGVYDHNIPFFPNGTYVNSNMKDFNPVYMNQWNLSIQRQIGQDWLLTANYLGNNTIHMITTENVNSAIYIPGIGDAGGNCTLNGQRVPFTVVPGAACSTVANQQSRRILSLQNPAQGQYYAGIGQIDDGGTASYEGLYLSVQKRLSHGLSAQANYTLSHCISDVYSDNPTAAGVSVPGNRRQFRSNCLGIDRRQLFGLNLVATTPKFSNTALRILGSNWQVAPILQIKSAQFFSVYAGTDRALTTVQNQTPDLVNSNVYPAHQTADSWINRSAFNASAPGTYGNLGYNNMKGPGTFQLNMALSRTFVIRERQSIQLRAEAFNLPNHVNLFTPGAAPNAGQRGGNVSLTAPNFGQITNDISGNNGLTAGDYRVIQLALKFVF